MFLHESGEWMRTRLGLIPVKDDPQGAGSAITYGRRYTLLGMCGVAPEEDDDGNAASRSPRGRIATPRAAQPAPVAPEPKEGPIAAIAGAAGHEVLEQIVRGFNGLDLDKQARGEWLARFTQGRVTDSSGLAHLTSDEARKLVRALVAEYKNREATAPCPLCTSAAGDPHFAGVEGWPCENDQSDAAMRVRADAVTLDSPRGPAATLEDEVELELPI